MGISNIIDDLTMFCYHQWARTKRSIDVRHEVSRNGGLIGAETMNSDVRPLKMFIDPKQLELAVEMQAKSYALLKWVGQAVSSGLLSFRTAHEYSSLPIAAKDWIEKHYLNIPSEARVGLNDLPVFANFFSTYLENSFDLIANPGRVKYSPDAHCFCPMCSWMVDAPHLKTKSLTTADKKRAMRMQINALIQLGIDTGSTVDERRAEEIASHPDTCEVSALHAYGHDLIQRLDAIANGPAVLALWRRFAWSSSGSPKPKFRLKSKMIQDAELRLRNLLLAQ